MSMTGAPESICLLQAPEIRPCNGCPLLPMLTRSLQARILMTIARFLATPVLAFLCSIFRSTGLPHQSGFSGT